MSTHTGETPDPVSDEKLTSDVLFRVVDDFPVTDTTLSDKRLLRKLDWHILPLISLMHLSSFLFVLSLLHAITLLMESTLLVGIAPTLAMRKFPLPGLHVNLAAHTASK
jgi:hypothetical protein